MRTLPLMLALVACRDKAGDAVAPGDAAANDTVEPTPPEPNAMAPGRYVASLIWEEGDLRLVRLSELELEASGAAVMSSWTMSQSTFDGYTDVWLIGESEQEAPHDDASSYVQGLAALAAPPAVRSGTWSTGEELAATVTWGDGDTETWRRTWHDDTLSKIEATHISSADEPASTYLTSGLDRNVAAVNAGWGFGGPSAPAFDQGGATGIGDLELDYLGGYSRWNGYYEPPDDDEGVAFGQLNAPVFYETSTGVLRYSFESGGYRAYAYLSLVPMGGGVHPRHVVYQISHDFDGDGNIADGPGHTYAGLQIVDSVGAVRGLVFADQSYDTGIEQVTIMSAMYYLDVFDDAAHTGVE